MQSPIPCWISSNRQKVEEKRNAMNGSGASSTSSELQWPNELDAKSISNYPIDALGPVAELAKSTAEIVQAPIEVVAQRLLSILSLVTQSIANVQTPFFQECPLSLCLVTAIESWPKKKFIDRILLFDIKRFEQEQQDLLIGHLRRKNSDNRTLSDRDVGRISLGCLHLMTASSFEHVVKGLPDLSGSILYSGDDLAQFVGQSGRKNNNYKSTPSNYFDKLWSGERFTLINGSTVQIIRDRRVSFSLYIDSELAPEALRMDRISARDILSKALISRPNWNLEYDNIVDATHLKPTGIEEFNDRCISLLAKVEYPPTEKFNEISPRLLKLGGEERKYLLEFLKTIETYSKPGDYFAQIRSFAENAAEHICRLAGVLEIYSNPDANKIGSSALNNAIELYKYYTGEIRNVQTPNSVDDAISDAERLLTWLKKQYQRHLEETGSPAFQVRYVLQRTHSSMRSKDKLARALKVLEDRQYVNVDSKTKEISLRNDAEE